MLFIVVVNKQCASEVCGAWERPSQSLAGITGRRTDLFLFMKYYLLMSPDGFPADPIYIMADEKIYKDDYLVYPVVGLHSNTAMLLCVERGTLFYARLGAAMKTFTTGLMFTRAHSFL